MPAQHRYLVGSALDGLFIRRVLEYAVGAGRQPRDLTLGIVLKLLQE
jgi:hypothetical protein